MTPTAPHSADYLRIREIPVEKPPSLVNARWRSEFPWLVQGTTTRGQGGVSFDLGLFNRASSKESVRHNWSELLVASGAKTVVHAQQVHGAAVRRHGPATDRSAGDVPTLVDPCDGHVTDSTGVLLAVTVADCVPVFVVDAKRRAVGMFHAGWRGVAAGVLERGLALMASEFGTDAVHVDMHLGPSICDRCYEVGPEVFAALDQPVPGFATPIDLRAVIADRALAVGVDFARLSISDHCTRCTDSGLFSHRGGDGGRQVGYLGVLV